MSRPDWCPQRVWDEVQELDMTTGGGRWDLAARAILRERAACAAEAKRWLDGWASDLAATWEAYIEAKNTGEMHGRRISPESADFYAKQFRERAEAVSGCADQVATALSNRGEHHD